MKKVFVIFAATLIAAFSAQAGTTTQELINKGKAAYASSSPRAIGLRLGYGVSLTYQQQVSANMVSIDIDAPAFSGVGAAVTYDWLNPFNTQIPWAKRGCWNWYLGAGLGASVNFSSHSYPIEENTRHSNTTMIGSGVVGRIGVEYEFWFPMQLALEYRPTIGIQYWKNSQHIEDINHVIKGDVTVDNGINFNVDGLVCSAITLCVRYKF